ncbi:hypothetical protein FPANT_2885 [Fusarium pseudoanthophilum]|uniref:Uncharacterized protein n=1 Tax=Fusarium pseudoanthophilum TaxID=48495 RepID=A0A8H5PNE5_9HYPO|nr:hypothetical protein FPANT_2885 [Fusarium pseudoanthophilum]
MSPTPVQASPAKAHTARLETPYVLTQVPQRRTRPSFSPQKTPHQQPKLSHKTSLSLDLDQGEQSSPVPPVATAALEFEEFSFRDSEGDISAKDVTKEQHMALCRFLFDQYNVTEIQESFPFLVLGCKGGPPAEDQRPFSIAGAIAIWMDAEEFGFMPIVGYPGQGEILEIEDAIVNQVEYLQIPSQDIILHFAKLWPDCLAISVLWTFLVVELPRVSDEEFVKRLETLPSGIEGYTEGCYLNLMFHNGPLPYTERLTKRIVQLDPKDLENQIADDTDYVTKDGKFYPVRSRDHRIGDEFIFDSFVSGTQTLLCYGTRFTPRWRPGPEPNVVYLSSRQGVFVTSAPKVFRKPQIRDSPDLQSTLLASESDIRHYLVYADLFDPLIDDR